MDILYKQGNDSLGIEACCADPQQTVGLQNVTLYSSDVIPVNTPGIILNIYIMANNGLTSVRGGYLMGLFYRNAGNLVLQGAPITNLVGLLAAGIVMQANTSTQKIEVIGTGIAGLTINWRLAAYEHIFKM